ncbi:hypothetical protein DFJ73DRAFT_324876 [Zopfochytrium polystomum]|nr:hypothetical protein DFJ73DRAFT_324876 [Zopfochytrium polystomum]
MIDPLCTAYFHRPLRSRPRSSFLLGSPAQPFLPLSVGRPPAPSPRLFPIASHLFFSLPHAKCCYPYLLLLLFPLLPLPFSLLVFCNLIFFFFFLFFLLLFFPFPVFFLAPLCNPHRSLMV